MVSRALVLVTIPLLWLSGRNSGRATPAGSRASERAAQQASSEIVRHSAGVLKAALNAPSMGQPYATVSGSHDSAMLGNIVDGITLPDGRIVLLDAMSDNVHVLGVDGRHSGMWGRRGQGPEEFTSVVQLGVIADSLLVVDQGGLRASVVTPKGRIIRRAVPRAGASVRARLGSGRWVATLPEEHRATGESRLDTLVGHVVILNDSGRVVDSLGRYTEELALLRNSPGMVTLIRLPYSPRGNVTVGGGRLAHHSGHEYKVHVVELATGKRRVIQFDSTPPAMTDRLYGEIVDAAIERVASEQRPTIRRLWQNRPRPSTVGGFTSVMLTQSGQLWLGLVDSPATTLDGPGTEHWLVLDDAGRVVHTLSLKPRERLLAVDKTSLVVVAKDEDDLQSIRLYRLPARFAPPR